MSAEITHTPLPWKFMESDGRYVIQNNQGNVAFTSKLDAYIDGTQAGNAALIVEAVNSHKQLEAAINLHIAIESQMQKRIDRLRESTSSLLALHDDAVFVCGSDDEEKVADAIHAVREALRGVA